MRNMNSISRQLYRIAKLLRFVAGEHEDLASVKSSLEIALGQLDAFAPMLDTIIRQKDSGKPRSQFFDFLSMDSWTDPRIQKSLDIIPSQIKNHVKNCMAILKQTLSSIGNQNGGRSIEELRNKIRSSANSPFYKLINDIDLLYQTRELKQNKQILKFIQERMNTFVDALGKALGTKDIADLKSKLTTNPSNTFNGIIQAKHMRRIRNRRKLAALGIP